MFLGIMRKQKLQKLGFEEKKPSAVLTPHQQRETQPQEN